VLADHRAARRDLARAQGQAGAAAKAVREAKRLLVKPRARVAQVRLTTVPVARSQGQ
jgi:hypothetical protein